MDDDTDLLRQYAELGDERAFAELVRAKVNLVHSAAARQVGGDAQLAQEVTQAVFTDLARKASTLTRHTSITGWLYTSTRFAAAKAVRAQARWQNRTREAQKMHEFQLDSGPSPDWAQLRGVLDDAMGELEERDREAVLLRYFEDRPLAEVGGKIGLSENSARMRVDRALDKLRAALSRRGVTSTAIAIGLVLTQQAVVAAPAGLANVVASTALAGVGTAAVGAAGASGAKAAWVKVVVAGLLGAAAGATAIVNFQANVSSLSPVAATPPSAVRGAAPLPGGARPNPTPRLGSGAVRASPGAAQVAGAGRGGGGGGGARSGARGANPADYISVLNSVPAPGTPPGTK